MKTIICKEFVFDAAHYLPTHDGKCKLMHGHTYKVLIAVTGTVCQNAKDPRYGMVLDFDKLKQVVQSHVINLLDHTVLNEVLPFVSTAENLAAWIMETVGKQISPNLHIEFVRVHETPTSYAEVNANVVRS